MIKPFQNYFYRQEYKHRDQQDVKIGLCLLSELLHKHFDRKVYVLIDEYDAPIHSAIQNALDIRFVNEIVVNGMIASVIKGNEEHVECGLMTGISSMVRASASSALNNVTEYNFLRNSKFTQYYGFTSEEVVALLTNFAISQDEQKTIARWYNGYISKIDGIELYTPWSIVKYIQTRTFESHWENSGAINRILQIFKIEAIRKSIEHLIYQQHLSIELKAGLTITDLENLNDILHCKSNTPIPSQHITLFFSYIFELGYLSFTSDKTSQYKIPNFEIRLGFIKNIKDYYIDIYSLQHIDIKNAVEQLNKLMQQDTAANIELFQKALERLFAPLALAPMSSIDTLGIHANKDLYHSIINVIAIQSRHQKFGTEIWNSNKARADIIVLVNYSEKSRYDT